MEYIKKRSNIKKIIINNWRDSTWFSEHFKVGLSNLYISKGAPQPVANNKGCHYSHDANHATILFLCNSGSNTCISYTRPVQIFSKEGRTSAGGKQWRLFNTTGRCGLPLGEMMKSFTWLKTWNNIISVK